MKQYQKYLPIFDSEKGIIKQSEQIAKSLFDTGETFLWYLSSNKVERIIVEEDA
mgnify:CR=1 FL=1